MDKKILWVGIASLLIIAAAVVLSMVFAIPPRFRGTSYVEPLLSAPQIKLKQASGTDFLLSDYKGKIVLLFFGYTSCPDVCPVTLAELKVALDETDGGDLNLQVVFISVDPQRDTPEKIQKYVEHFDDSFIGLSGSIEQLEPVWTNYGVYREVVQGGTAMNYIVNHTARVTLVDAQGNLRLSYGFQTPPADIAHDIDILLGE